MYKPMKLILFLLPLIEIALFILVGDIIGVFKTLLLIILSTFLGLVIIRKQNFEFMRKLHKSLKTGQPPQLNLMDNSMTLLAGFLLLIPGFFTDILGLFCLLPFLRSQLLKLFIASKIITIKRVQENQHTIEGECWHENNEKTPSE